MQRDGQQCPIIFALSSKRQLFHIVLSLPAPIDLET